MKNLRNEYLRLFESRIRKGRRFCVIERRAFAVLFREARKHWFGNLLVQNDRWIGPSIMPRTPNVHKALLVELRQILFSDDRNEPWERDNSVRVFRFRSIRFGNAGDRYRPFLISAMDAIIPLAYWECLFCVIKKSCLLIRLLTGS